MKTLKMMELLADIHKVYVEQDQYNVLMDDQSV
jgi:hypothetical protein